MFWLQNRGQSGSRYIYIYILRSGETEPETEATPIETEPNRRRWVETVVRQG